MPPALQSRLEIGTRESTEHEKSELARKHAALSRTLALCGADFLPEDSRAEWPTADLTITAIPDIGVLLNSDSVGAELSCSEYRPKELPKELRKEISDFEAGIDVGIKILETRIPDELWGDDRAG